MILVGGYLSPFTRRVAIAIHIYEIAYKHETLSAHSDLKRLMTFNPVGRVPTLILDSGEILVESAAILDYLDELVGETRALIAPCGDERRATLRVCALANGVCEKASAMLYERGNHEVASKAWLGRCKSQAEGGLDALEKDRSGRTTPYWFGNRLTHADVAVACAMTYLGLLHPQIAGRQAWPALAAHANRCEELPAFKAVLPSLPPMVSQPASRAR